MLGRTSLQHFNIHPDRHTCVRTYTIPGLTRPDYTYFLHVCSFGMFTCLHACVTCLHSDMVTILQFLSHPSIHLYSCTRIHACIHHYVYIHACIHPCMYTSMHVYTHACIHSCMYTFMHVYIHGCHTLIRAYIRTCLYTHTHSFFWRVYISVLDMPTLCTLRRHQRYLYRRIETYIQV